MTHALCTYRVTSAAPLRAARTLRRRGTERNRLRGDLAFAFLHGDHLVSGHVGQRINLPAWPPDHDARRLVGFAQPERHRQFALRTVTRTGLHQAPELLLIG